MKLLVLGGSGMAGHMIVQYFSSLQDYDVFYTTRHNEDKVGIHLDVTNAEELEKTIAKIKPDIVINCVGLLNENARKRLKEAIFINSYLPHLLASLAKIYSFKLIHISTDCVFSGKKGNYTENDEKDGLSHYAKTKALGEIYESPHATIRTSIIGPEKKANGIGLFLWFMKQRGTIKGYSNVKWNGVTTLQLAKSIETIIKNNITGLIHVTAPKAISKYELLKLFQEVFAKTDVHIEKDESVVLDRTLKNTRKDFEMKIPDYKEMLVELKQWMILHGNE